MITKISGESPFQVLTSSFSISPSESGYQLEISADGVNYSPLFTVGAGVTRLVTGVAASSYYRLAGNTSDVVVNWQKSCGGDGHDGGGGGGTGATITVDTALSSSSTNPVENRVITNALAEIDGGTVDSAITSGSTNAVESRAIWDVLNGVSSTTELHILETDSTWKLNTGTGPQFYFKNTSIEKYKALYLGDLEYTIDYLLIIILDGNGGYWYSDPSTQVSTSTIGTLKYNLIRGGGAIYFDKNYVDGTFEYYILLDVEEMSYVVYKTLPTSFVEISDHKANVSDVPTAQDNSDFNQFVYNGEGNKSVVSSVSTYFQPEINSNNRQQVIYTQRTGWNNSGNTTSSRALGSFNGSEVIQGFKSPRDSKIINKTEQVLDGFTEQITLTIGSRTTDSINLRWEDRYFYETDNPRYIVYPISEVNVTGDLSLDSLSLSGTTYYVSNGLSRTDSYNNINGIYELELVRVGNTYVYYNSTIGNNYIIIDKELLTLEISNSLTITRGKSLVDAFNNIPTPDMSDYWTTAETQTAIQEALYGAIITGATTPVDDHLDSASTWPVENRVITNKFNDYYTKQEADALIADMATEQYVDNAIAAIPTGSTINIDNALNTGSTNPVENRVVANAINNISNQIPDISGLASTTYVDNAISTELDDVVRSTSITTIVRCTQAQYDAIAVKDEGTLYIITGVNP